MRNAISAGGEVAFLGNVSGGNAPGGVFVHSDAGIRAVALPGDVALFVDRAGADAVVALAGDLAPGTGGGTLSDLNSVSIFANGEVVFFADVTGGSASNGLFVGRSQGTEVPALGPAGVLSLSGLLAGAAGAALRRPSRTRRG